jgi:N-acetyl-anhydromuramyl-L-alanine amidase AmpD
MQFDQNGWLDVAVEIDILENTFDRQGYRPNFIVLHGTAGGSSAENVADYMKSTVGTNNPVSTHFVIGQDGEIVQCVPISLAAWGNGIMTQGHASYLPDNVNPNLYTVSIEHVKPSTDNSDALTEAQSQSSFALIQCICDTYGIPKQAGSASGGIIRHADIDPVNRSRCPGPYPWNDLWNYLEGVPAMITLQTPRVSDYFTSATSDGSTWSCKQNGFLVGHGILTFYQQFGGSALCGLTYLGLPLSNETQVTGKPAGVVYQKFERATVLYDPNHTVDLPPGSGAIYLAHTDAKF